MIYSGGFSFRLPLPGIPRILIIYSGGFSFRLPLPGVPRLLIIYSGGFSFRLPLPGVPRLLIIYSGGFSFRLPLPGVCRSYGLPSFPLHGFPAGQSLCFLLCALGQVVLVCVDERPVQTASPLRRGGRWVSEGQQKIEV